MSPAAGAAATLAKPASIETGPEQGAAQGSPPNTQNGPTQAQTAAALVLAALHAGDIDRAVTALDRLREANGDPGQVAALTGVVKLAQIDLDGARAAFEEAVRLDPKAVSAKVDLARVLALQGHSDEAIDQLQAMMTADPANAAALTALVNLQLAARHPDKAVAAAEAAHQAAPNDPGITAGLAQLYMQTGQAQKTLDLLDQSAKPGDGSGSGSGAGSAAANAQRDDALLAVRAQAQLAMGQRGEAEKTLRTVLDQMPDNVVLRRQIAELMVADKKYDDARALLSAGLARHPGDPVLLSALVALARQEGGPAAALTRVEELARDPANTVTAGALKGDLLMSENRFADAAAAYQAVQAALPKDDPQAQSLQIRTAQAVTRGGDSAKGAAMLRDWIAAHPASTEAALALASLDITANRLPAARTRLEEVLATQPNNPTALNNLAWISQQQGDLAQARALAARAYLLGPAPQTADTLGWIVLAQGHAADALALLREAANGQPQIRRSSITSPPPSRRPDRKRPR